MISYCRVIEFDGLNFCGLGSYKILWGNLFILIKWQHLLIHGVILYRSFHAPDVTDLVISLLDILPGD